MNKLNTMERIEQGAWAARRNYIREVVVAMVTAAERNKQRVNFWLAVAALLVTIGMNFVPWVYKQIGESAVQAERFEQNKKAQEAQTEQIKTLTTTIEALTNQVRELKSQTLDLETKINQRRRGATRVNVPSQVVRGGRPIGQADELRADPPLPSPSGAPVRN